MGLDIYFYDDDIEIEDEYSLKITHNLNVVVSECGILTNNDYYKLIWRPDELFDVPNGRVVAQLILDRLPMLIQDLIVHEESLKRHLPKNGWGTYQQLIKFLCDYLNLCYVHRDKFVYCCR